MSGLAFLALFLMYFFTPMYFFAVVVILFLTAMGIAAARDGRNK